MSLGLPGGQIRDHVHRNICSDYYSATVGEMHKISNISIKYVIKKINI